MPFPALRHLLILALAAAQLGTLSARAAEEPAAATAATVARVAPTTTAPLADAAKPAAPAPAAKGEREGWPTEEEAKATILKIEYAINASETNKKVWKVKDFHHEVKSVKFAQETAQRQMRYGAKAITVYPVRILYTQVTDYEGKDSTRVETGADGVWYFYRDSFGDWTAKYGNP